MQFDYSKLRGKIKEVAGTMYYMAELMGISKMGLYYKMSGRFPFTQHDIMKACDVLGIPVNEIPEYFFKIKVS